MSDAEIKIEIVASVILTPIDVINACASSKQRAFLHAICLGSKLRIAEVREIVNSPGYDE